MFINVKKVGLREFENGEKDAGELYEFGKKVGISETCCSVIAGVCLGYLMRFCINKFTNK